MDKAKIKQLINIVFLLCIFMYILLSLLKSFVKPNEIIEMENRYANKYDSISLKKYVNGTLQDNIENTLSDQVILSSRLKKGNNYIKGLSLKKYVDLYFKRHDLDYLNAGDVNFYGPENLVYYYRDLNNISQYLDKKIENYNSFASKNKDVNVYLYYIEKDTDINFKTGKKVDIFEYIQKRLNNIKASKFEIDNFEDLYSEKLWEIVARAITQSRYKLDYNKNENIQYLKKIRNDSEVQKYISNFYKIRKNLKRQYIFL